MLASDFTKHIHPRWKNTCTRNPIVIISMIPSVITKRVSHTWGGPDTLSSDKLPGDASLAGPLTTL